MTPEGKVKDKVKKLLISYDIQSEMSKDWVEFSKGCPWKTYLKCTVLHNAGRFGSDGCRQERCAPYHFVYQMTHKNTDSVEERKAGLAGVMTDDKTWEKSFEAVRFGRLDIDEKPWEKNLSDRYIDPPKEVKDQINAAEGFTNPESWTCCNGPQSTEDKCPICGDRA